MEQIQPQSNRDLFTRISSYRAACKMQLISKLICLFFRYRTFWRLMWKPVGCCHSQILHPVSLSLLFPRPRDPKTPLLGSVTVNQTRESVPELLCYKSTENAEKKLVQIALAEVERDCAYAQILFI